MKVECLFLTLLYSMWFNFSRTYSFIFTVIFNLTLQPVSKDLCLCLIPFNITQHPAHESKRRTVILVFEMIIMYNSHISRGERGWEKKKNQPYQELQFYFMVLKIL